MSDSAALWTAAYQAPPSMEFFRQEYWSGLPFPSPGDLPNPGIEPGYPALQANTLPSKPPGKSIDHHLFGKESVMTISICNGSNQWFYPELNTLVEQVFFGIPNKQFCSSVTQNKPTRLSRPVGIYPLILPFFLALYIWILSSILKQEKKPSFQK